MFLTIGDGSSWYQNYCNLWDFLPNCKDLCLIPGPSLKPAKPHSCQSERRDEVLKDPGSISDVFFFGWGGVYGMENRNAYGTKAQTCASYWFTMETIFWNGYLNLCNRGTLIVLRGLLVVKSNGWCDFPKQSLELSEDVLGQNTI